MKRFYKEVAAKSVEGGFGVHLDGRLVKTNAKKPIPLSAAKQQCPKTKVSLDPQNNRVTAKMMTSDGHTHPLCEEVLVHIFSFVKNPCDLLNCELVCRSFNFVLTKDDRCWEHFPLMEEPEEVIIGKNRREQILFQRSMEIIHHYKREDEKMDRNKLENKNLLLRTLGVHGCQAFFQAFFTHGIEVRGDTLGLVAEYIEHFVGERLRGAWAIATSMTRLLAPHKYPCLNGPELDLFDKIFFRGNCNHLSSQWERYGPGFCKKWSHAISGSAIPWCRSNNGRHLFGGLLTVLVWPCTVHRCLTVFGTASSF